MIVLVNFVETSWSITEFLWKIGRSSSLCQYCSWILQIVWCSELQVWILTRYCVISMLKSYKGRKNVEETNHILYFLYMRAPYHSLWLKKCKISTIFNTFYQWKSEKSSYVSVRLWKTWFWIYFLNWLAL